MDVIGSTVCQLQNIWRWLAALLLHILPHCVWVTYICISKLNIIGSDNGLLPGWCQAIIWTNAGNIVYWTLRYIFQWNLHWNSYIFIQRKCIWKCHFVSASMCENLAPIMYSELRHHWCKERLVACLTPSHYLNHCRFIVTWTLRNKLHWNFNQNSTIFLKENDLNNDIIWVSFGC